MAHAPSTVVKTIQANVATLGFIQRGLPGQPEGSVLRDKIIYSVISCDV